MSLLSWIVYHFVVEPEFPQMQLKEDNGGCEDMMSGLWDPYSVISACVYSECQIHSRSNEAESPPLSETRRSCQGMVAPLAGVLGYLDNPLSQGLD